MTSFSCRPGLIPLKLRGILNEVVPDFCVITEHIIKTQEMDRIYLDYYNIVAKISLWANLVIGALQEVWNYIK